MPVPQGAAAVFLERMYGGLVVPRESVVAVQPTVTELVGGDPERLELTLVNLGTAAIVVAPSPQVTTQRGIRLDPAGGTIVLRVNDDGMLPAMSWHAISEGAAGNAYILEVRRDVVI